MWSICACVYLSRYVHEYHIYIYIFVVALMCIILPTDIDVDRDISQYKPRYRA